MPRFRIWMFFPLLLSITASVAAAEPQDGVWPWWRGPNHDGVAAPDQSPPLRWSAEENIAWSADIPGKGHGSPVVTANRVLLATADIESQRQEVLCFDRQTGKLIWQTAVHRSGLIEEGNKKATLASSTPAVVDDRVFINFLNDQQVVTSALRLQDGEPIWQTPVSKYKVHQGYGSSPIPFENLLLVSADNKGGGAIAALSQATGEVVWRRPRPQKPNYPSPSLVQLDGQTRMVMTGCDLVTCLDPASGQALWEIEGATTECVTTAVSNGSLIFTSGGYPKNHVAAVAADGSGKVAWETKTRVYVPSMLLRGSHLYAVADQGFAICWNCETGEEMWKVRMPGGGGYTASPVMVGDRIYASSETGRMTVLRAAPQQHEVLAQNQLGDEIYATPAICGGRIFARVVHTAGGQRQERLYCIGD